MGWEREFALSAGDGGGAAGVIDVRVARGNVLPAAFGVEDAFFAGGGVRADYVVKDVSSCGAGSVWGLVGVVSWWALLFDFIRNRYRK